MPLIRLTRPARRVSARARRRWALFGAALGACLTPAVVHAAWPPPPTATAADLKNPANWPNDPNYGYNADPANPASGQWNLYGFLPDRTPGAPPVMAGETASGMSVDLAWRHTIGDDHVLIAILDSGLEWDDRDLINKVYLNKGELQNHLPKHADGSSCAPLDPSKPGQDLFDCNGDGILTVADYADDPDLQPAADSTHPLGDANRNGVFDAGDLILNFSDGVDDDHNGYVDDIAGWDFMKNDNDPYDDTRYAHGTGEARDSSAETNNGISNAGVCPLCRFLPLRVGDSFIVDSQAFAKAAIYATDNGARIIQEALGTIDMSRFAQSALDYAWSHGTIVIASMADEDSRHHNMPATSNHTLPVHAITMGGSDESTRATTFLAFNTCSNYGAQNLLSASGEGCSSEATGVLSGITGLVYSEGLASGYGGANGSKPPLTPGEVMQLLITTADDINVPASHDPSSPLFYSQPGFDQRFGYGRVNANSAVEAVEAGKIPPDVDIVSPRWFQILYPDQLTAPVPIMGTVSAARANSYDVTVEWAPGVQPLDQDFHVISQLTNVSSSKVLGGDGSPLASLDVRKIDITHPEDPDSPHGENKYTITVRVRAVAHYGGAIGDVKAILHRAYYVYNDPDLVAGFPIDLGASGESSPKLADIDGDGVRDIVVATADGEIYVYSIKNGKPVVLPGFPFKAKKVDGLDGDPSRPDYRSAPGYGPNGINTDLAREAFEATPAVADIDGDGKPEIVATTYSGTIYVIESDGSVRPGWPVRLPDVPSCPLDGSTPTGLCMSTTSILDRGAFASPVLADLKGDGKLDVIQAAFDGYVHVYQPDGTPLPGWPVRVHDPAASATEYNRIITTPAVADFNGDGIPDVLVGSNEKLGGGDEGAVYIIDGRGTAAGNPPYLKDWPINLTSLDIFPLVAEGIGNSPVAADMNGDGKPDAIFHGNASAPLILPTDPGKQSGAATPPNALPVRTDPSTGKPVRGLEATSLFGADSKAQQPDVMFPLFAQPSIGDMNQDGTPDIVTSGGSLTLAGALEAKNSTAAKGGGQNLLAMWDGKTGAMLPGSPEVLEDFTFFNNQAIADLDGDGYPEAITGSGGYFVHAYDACGREPTGFPKFTGQWIIATAAVGDIDGDKKLELVIDSREGWLYAWHTGASSDGVISWESFHHDNRNTGYVGTQLDQGKLLGTSGPLKVDKNGSCVATKKTFMPIKKWTLQPSSPAKKTSLAASGGCSCRVAGSPSPTRLWMLLGLPALLLERRRRRSRSRHA
jgi:Subtilase family/FG-GAP-like repeat/FG-GAP repeat